MKDKIVLRAENITRTVSGSRSLLDRVSFELGQGERLVVVGPSGAGKTTLLRILQRLDDPTSGRVLFHDQPYENLSPVELRRKIAFVFQEPALFDGTVEDNLRIHELLGFQSAPFSEKSIREALQSVGLESGFLSHNSQNLSTGEVKRVAIACSLLGNPEVLLLDEPTANLDPTRALELIETLKKLTENGLTILAVMHQVEHARRLATRAILIIDGSVVESASGGTFFSSPQKDLTRRFLRGELNG